MMKGIVNRERKKNGEKKEKREQKEKEERERLENLEQHDPGAELPEELEKTLIEVIGENAASFVKNPEMFTGVVLVSPVNAHGSAIVTGYAEFGSGYTVEDGIVVEEYDYASVSIGFESNIGGDVGQVITVLPGAETEQAFGESFTASVGAGYMVASGTAGIESVSTENGEINGYTISYQGGYSVSPFDVSATYNYTWRRH